MRPADQSQLSCTVHIWYPSLQHRRGEGINGRGGSANRARRQPHHATPWPPNHAGAGTPCVSSQHWQQIQQRSQADDLEVAAMATEMRKTGIGVVGDMPWGTHFCHFYETKEDLLDTL